MADLYASWQNSMAQIQGVLTQANEIIGELQIPGEPVALPAFTPSVESFISSNISLPEVIVSELACDNISLNPLPTPPSMEIGPSTVDPGDAPVFTTPQPSLNYPAPPALTDVAVPTPPVTGAVAVPEQPSYTMPIPPELFDILLPQPPVITLPTFAAQLDAPPVEPILDQAYTEVLYTSDLLEDLNAHLIAYIEGLSTSMSRGAEAAIWDREREKLNVPFKRKLREGFAAYAARGIDFSEGPLWSDLMDLEEDDVDARREVQLKLTEQQMKLEQENFHFSFKQGLAKEATLVKFNNAMQQRLFEFEMGMHKLFVAIFDAKVGLFEALGNAYATEAQVFRERVKAEVIKLDLYKAVISGQRAIAELNLLEAQQYEAEVKAVTMLAEFYRNQVEAFRLLQENEKLKILNYREQVNAYAETVKAKATDYQLYASQVLAETTKVKGYKSLAEAYKSQADAFKATVLTRTAEVEFDIKSQIETPVKLFSAQLASLTQQLAAELDAVRACEGMRIVDIEVGKAHGMANASAIADQATIEQGNNAIRLADVEVQIERHRVQSMQQIAQARLISTIQQAQAQIGGQIAAATAASLQYRKSRGESKSHARNNYSSSTNYVSTIEA